MVESISHLERDLCVVMPMEEFERSENKSVESTSKADIVDQIRELKKHQTDFETNNNCFGEAQSKDSACEARNLAADRPVHILKKRFQKEKKASISMKYKILRDLRIQKHKRIITELEAENKKMRKENAKLEAEINYMRKETAKLEAENKNLRKEMAKLKAEIRRTEELLNRISALKFETDVKLDPIANVKSEVDILTFKPLLESFLEQIDANVKSQVDSSDFKILEEDIGKDSRMVGRLNVPLCLAPISERIYDFFGDISSESYLSDCVAKPSYVLFCAAIKEMDDLKLEQVTETKMLLWRDAINCALNVQFKVGFAKKHLKKIARAYFGLKAMEEKSNEDGMLWEIARAYFGLKAMKSNEELKNINGTLWEIAVLDDCIREAIYFRGKPLSTGLFH